LWQEGPWSKDKFKKSDEFLAAFMKAATPTQQVDVEREKKLGELREQLAKLKEKNLMDEMTNEQKLAYKLDSYMLFLEGTARPGRLGNLLDQIEEQTLLGEIAGLQRKKGSAGTALPALSHGSLARVGGFGMMAAEPVAQRMELVVRYTQATARHTEETAAALQAIRMKEQFERNRSEFFEGWQQL
jgi:hypothetical protein